MNDQNNNSTERASKLIIANKENAFKLVRASRAVKHKNDIKGKQLDTLIDTNLANALDLTIAVNKELVILNLEKEEQITALIEAKEKAEESDNLKSAFLANMYHEIRTPLNGILGFANLLRKPDLANEKQKKYLKIIEKSSARFLNTIDDIIDMSKIHSGQVKVNLHETNINKQIEKIYNFFKPEAESKGIKLVVKNSLPTKDSFFLTDSEKIYTVLIHLVKNALKYTQEGSIEFGYRGIKSSTWRNDLMFFVKDTGIGIPKERQKAIFENFTQSDIFDKVGLQGNGLGLSISKAYVELLEGKIWAESVEGKGTKFYFSLPYRIDLEDKLIQKKAMC